MISLVVAASQGLARRRFFPSLCGKRGLLNNHALLSDHRCTDAFTMALVRWIHRLRYQSQGSLFADATYQVNHKSPRVS
ncbi:hypothetical protein ACI6Q5_17045 [Xanthomonas codiaei]|uniref:Uncharacterized protein n=1 Tax=Xanthomonas codiaei TaxID=56463 RepID=A0A2S7CRV8_9XANT|nr:hypothetical protein [Xanthomonas codiaei]PPU64324.1 hypothetical protein XcodCFBP4690_09115 [Xanthomonas codiaei]